jgi:hypothetical protein
MASRGVLSHNDSLGRNGATRVGQCDGTGYVGENVAVNPYGTAAYVFNQWKESSGHNENMLRPSARSIGIGMARGGSNYYWTTDFSSANANWNGGTPPAEPTATATPIPPTATATSAPTATTVPGQPTATNTPNPTGVTPTGTGPTATSAPTIPPDQIKITVDRGDGGNYKIGDPISSCITVSTGAYVRIINKLPDGTEDIIYEDLWLFGPNCISGIAGPDPGVECMKLQLLDEVDDSVISESQACYNIVSEAGEIVVTYSFSIPGLGPNTNLGENPFPSVEDIREVEIQVVDTNGALVRSVKGLAFVEQGLSYHGFKTLGTGITGGNSIKIRINNSLFKTAATVILQPGAKITLPSVKLVTGDINQDNQLSLIDYNAMVGCYGIKACNNKVKTDLNVDGKVDEKDINIFYSGLAKRAGD